MMRREREPMESTWLKDRTWTPFLKDGTLPIRYEKMPWLASCYTFEETCRILRIFRNHYHVIEIAYDYWSWFSAPLKLRDQSSSPERSPRERAEKGVASP
jgi:hypothetical protein